jgi:hypothetical protein
VVWEKCIAPARFPPELAREPPLGIFDDSLPLMIFFDDSLLITKRTRVRLRAVHCTPAFLSRSASRRSVASRPSLSDISSSVSQWGLGAGALGFGATLR